MSETPFEPDQHALHANVVGDSHAHATYQEGAYSDSKSGLRIRVETVYIPELKAHEFLETGPANPMVRHVILQRMTNQQILRTRSDGEGKEHLSIHPRNGIRPTLLIAGDGDIRGVFLPQLAAYDYRIPALSTLQPGPIASLTPILFEEVLTYAASLLQPYFDGLAVLKRLGMTRLAVSSLPPPGLDDDLFAAHNGYRAHRDSRYKAVLLFNAILQANCVRLGIGFVDTWTETTGPDGYLNPDFYLDGTHLNEAGGAIAVSKLFSAF